MPRSRRRKQRPRISQPKPASVRPANRAKPIAMLPFINLGSLSKEEVRTARQIPKRQCASCDGTSYLTMVASWRNTAGVAYLAAFCGRCINEAGTPTQKEPYEVELRIDLALFDAATEKVEVSR